MTVKQILYSLQNCSLGQSAARAPTPATPHHPQFPHKMRRRHLESVSSRSLSVRGSWGTAPSVFWHGAPGGSQGERRSGGALEGCLSHRDSDPTWSKARDDAYAQKERPAGEAYRSSPCGDSATPPGDHKFAQ